MAFIPKITACTLNCCQLLKVRDVTMAYDVVLNATGWGNPNIEHTDVASAILTVELPNGTILTEDVTAIISAAQIDPVDLHIFSPTGTTFPDGIYNIAYVIIDNNGDTYTTNIYTAIEGTVACCVDKMFAQLPNKMCDTCNYTEFLNNALQAEALLRAYRCASSCGDTTKANGILEALQTICNWADCNCSS